MFTEKSFILLKFRINQKLLWKDDIIINRDFPCRININPIIKDEQCICTELTCIMKLDPYNENNHEFYLNTSINYINNLITIYKCFKNYNITNITSKDLQGYCICYLDKKGTYIENIGSSSTIVCISGKDYISDVPDSIKNILLTKNNNLPLWLISLNEAKYYFELNFYADAIIHANIALENFAYTYIHETFDPTKASNILEKISPCYTCDLKKDKTKKTVHVTPREPSIYTILKSMFDHSKPDNITKNKFNCLIKNINKYRNDIVHGRDYSNITKENAECSINSLEQLITLFLNTNINNFIENKYKITNQPITDNVLEKLDLKHFKINSFIDLPKI